MYILFFHTIDPNEKGKEDLIPTGLKSLSNSAPNSPFMSSKMGNRPRDAIINRTAIVQPNFSSLNTSKTYTSNKGSFDVKLFRLNLIYIW